MSIIGKNVLLTGAVGGIGKHIAVLIAQNGGNLALIDHPTKQHELEDLKRKLERYSVTVKLFTGDLVVDTQVDLIFNNITKEMGPIDIFISNAATECVGFFHSQTEEDIVKTFFVNIISPIRFARKMIPMMLRQGGGHFVFISSYAGKIGLPFQAIYSASKAGLIKWIIAMRREYQHKGINFSVITPGYVSDSGMYALLLSQSGQKLKTPFVAGEVSPRKVAQKVVNAILYNKLDVYVARPYFKLLSIINEWMPRFITSLLNFTKITQYNEKLAVANKTRKEEPL